MIQNVLILGGGTCGCQIAWQCALHMINVTLVEPDQSAGLAAMERLTQTASAIVSAGRWNDRQLKANRERIRLFNDQQHTGVIDHQLGQVDLVIESVPEVVETKRAVLARIKPHLNPHAIIATNSSYLLPSAFIRDVTDPARLASLHFHVPVWYANAVDIMPHNRTAAEVVEALTEFAQRIDQTPIRLRREQPGYLFNSLLNPLLTEAIGLARRGIADRDQIDLAWRVITKMDAGPFDMIRLIGPGTVAGILRMGAARTKNPRLKLDADYLEQADLGPYVVPVSVSDQVKPHHIDFIAAPLESCLIRLPQLHGTAIVLGDSATEVGRAMADRFFAQAGRELAYQAKDGWPIDKTFEDSAHLIWHIDRVTCGTDDERLLSHLQAWWAKRLDDPAGRATTLTLVGRASIGLSGLVRAMAIELAMHRRFFPAVRLVEYDDALGFQEAKAMISDELAISQQQVLDGSPEEAKRRYADCHIRYGRTGRMRPVFSTARWWPGTQTAIQNQPTAQVKSTEQVTSTAQLEPVAGRGSLAGCGSLAGGRWLLIGGGRGITFEMAMWLGQAGCEVDLVNRSRPVIDFDVWDDAEIDRRRRQVMRDAYQQGQRPDTVWSKTESSIEIARNLDRLRLAGVVHRLHVIDISAESAVESIGKILGSGPRLDGIIYGAGWERTSRFEKKSAEEMATTIRSKLVGLRRLIDAINIDTARRCPLRLVVSGSLSGVFGGSGQVDYAHANSRAAAMLMSAAEDWPDCQAILIDWPGWEQAGMAERSASKFMLQKAGHRMITVDEGLQALRDSIFSGGRRERVVLIRSGEIPEWLHDARSEQRGMP